MVVCDESHVVRVDSPKWGHPVTDDSEQCNKNIVYNVGDIVGTFARAEPACGNISTRSLAGKYTLPMMNKTQTRPKMVINVAYKVTANPSAVERQTAIIALTHTLLTFRNVFPKAFHLPLEFRPSRVQLMPDMIVQVFDVLFRPILDRK